MDSTNIMAVSGLVVSVVGMIYTAVNHKRIRSNCCGHDLVASIDVESTTPPLKAPEKIVIRD